MPEISAATWSAVAATLSAFVAVMAWRIQLLNLRESVRPVLVLEEWRHREMKSGEVTYDEVGFKAVRNVGRGVAMHVSVGAGFMEGNCPVATMQIVREPVIAAGDVFDVDGSVTIWWKNLKPHANGDKYLFLPVVVRFWDTRNEFHETIYHLLVVEPHKSDTTFSSDSIARGVMLTTLESTTVPRWRLRLSGRLNKLKKLTYIDRVGSYLSSWFGSKKQKA
jgi:hypothetical protein